MGRATPLIPPPVREITLSKASTLRLGTQLGRGSMATVYRALETRGLGIETAVAVKVFDIVASDEHESIFEILARTVRDSACIRHPNVVQTLDLGFITPLQPFVVSELVEGRPLAALLDAYQRAGRRMPLDLALFIGVEIADALAGARCACSSIGIRLGLTHGELSPSDVLLSWNGEVKVTDFGIAASARAASSIRSFSALARRARALAPEVARGRGGDARSDVFSLGITLRAMMLGPRFPASISDTEALELARDGVVVDGVFEPQLPDELTAILQRALDLDPANRYPHAGALADELRGVAYAMGVGDGRAFLRNALPRVLGDGSSDEEVTSELLDRRTSQPEPTDRFARLRGDRPSGTLPRAIRMKSGVLDEEDGIELDDFEEVDDG
jgi:eukaryotic-like serine/threonine-protein kinase